MSITSEHVRLFVVSKSREMTKTSRAGYQYTVRYLTCQRADDPSIGYSISIYPDRRTGEWLPVYVFSEIYVPLRELRVKAIDDKFDKNIDGQVFRQAFWVNGFTNNEIVSNGRYYSKQRSISIPVNTVKFYTSHIEAGNGGIKIGATDLGFDYFPLGLNNVASALDGDINIYATFEYRIRSFTASDGTREFKRILVYVDGTIDLEQSDLSLLKSAITSIEEDAKVREILDEIRNRLREGFFLSVSEIQDMILARGLPADRIDANAFLENATLKKDYEAKFFRMLKEIHEDGNPIYYSDDGFVFRINGSWVWEIPTYGSATYLFDGNKDSGELVAWLKNASKIEIIRSKDVQRESGFIRRVIHPKDAENDDYVERWFEEVQGK